MPTITCIVQPSGEAAVELGAAAARGGLPVIDDPARADAVVWCSQRPDGLDGLLASAPGVRWVQLPMAGVERFIDVIRSHADQAVWTCAKAAYGPMVAEMAVGMLIVGFRNVHRYLTARSWEPLPGRLLAGANVAVLGAGGIGRALVAMLAPFDADVVVVSRSGAPVDGARAVRANSTMDVVSSADAVVLAVPLTGDTAGMVDRRFLDAMQPSAWLVNVARGGIVVTDDLVDALRRHAIAGAALDVTDPEPLPDVHPLWDLENAVLTPHVANTPVLGAPALIRLVEENARRFASGTPLLGPVDPEAGY